jgi:hypothetical protein
MKGDGRNRLERDAAGLERALRDLIPVRTPPGLRERVLSAASVSRGNAALAPGLRVVAAACASAILAVLLIDPLLGRHEAARLAAVLDGRPSAPAAESGPDLAEVLAGHAGEMSRMDRLQARARLSGQDEIERDFIKARTRLEGWLEDETSEDPD